MVVHHCSMPPSSGHFPVVKFLLEAGAEIDAVNNLGSTPLFGACMHGHLDVVRELLMRGANLFKKEHHKQDSF